MKKLISLVLMMALCISTLSACGQEPATNDVNSSETSVETSNVESDLASAKEYLTAMYRNAPSTNAKDFEVVGKLMVGETSYSIEWTADSDTVKFVSNENNMVTVDIDEKNPEEVKFNLTAKISDANGNSESVSFAKRVPAAVVLTEDMSYEEIVNAAYTLEEGLSVAELATLKGTISAIDTPYNPDYKNITVKIVVEGATDKPIVCFRLSGEGADKLAEGDIITVTGTLKNHKGTIEFDKGCTLDAVEGK